jgi:hypothetical protein
LDSWILVDVILLFLLPECVEGNRVELTEGADELVLTAPVRIEDTVKVVKDKELGLMLAN